MLDSYIFLLPFALLIVAMIGFRLLARRNGADLPLFYLTSKQKERLDPARMQRFRMLRKVGLILGFSIIGLGYVSAVAFDSPSGITVLLYSVGVLVAVSSALYLEYCIATGQISAPSEN